MIQIEEIRSRAYAFVKEWDGAKRESAEAKPFWHNFLKVFGVDRRVRIFERAVKKGQQGRW